MILANAGSPIIWFGILHLLIVNLLIGIVESKIIKSFQIEANSLLIVISNYLSMIIGMFFIAPYISTQFGNNDFWGSQTQYGEYNLYGFYIGMFCSFVISLLIEYPLVWFSIKNRLDRRRLPIPYFLANLATNFFMLLIYILIINKN